MKNSSLNNETPAPSRPPIRRIAVLLLAVALVGVPLASLVAWGIGGLPGAAPVFITGMIVSASAGAGLAILTLMVRRDPSPAGQINAKLAHVVARLLLTAGGLLGYLLTLPESQRRVAGFIGIGWYVVTWAIDLLLVRDKAPHRRAESLHCPTPTD